MASDKEPEKDRDDPFTPRTSLGRSPPQTLAPPPVSIETRARLPTSRTIADRDKEGAGPSVNLPKEQKRKKRSPDEGRGSANQKEKVPKRDTGKPLRVRIASSTEEGSGAESSCSEDEEEEDKRGEGAFRRRVALDREMTELSTFIMEVAKKKKSITVLAAQKLQDAIRKIKEGVEDIKMEHAEIKGKYLESVRVNKDILNWRSSQEEYIKAQTEKNEELKELATSTLRKVELNLSKMDLSQGPTQSYAGVAKANLAHLQAVNQNRPETRTLLFYPPNEKKAQTSEETKNTLRDVIKPAEQGIKIARVSNIRNGGVAIEVQRDQARDVISRVGGTLQSREPAKRLPKFKIFDIPNGKSDEDTIAEIKAQNFPEMGKEDFVRQFRLIHKVGPRNQPTCHWVVEVSTNLRKGLLELGGRLYLGWSSCKYLEHVIITRCFKCQKFGHLAKECKARSDTCGHCAKEGHSFKDCPDSRWEAKCSNCLRAKLKANHGVNSSECAVFLREKQRIVLMTDYGQ